MKRRKFPAVIHMSPRWVRSLNECMAEYEPGKWGPARPLALDYFYLRWKAAWLVFTGRADALLWPGRQ